MNAVSKEMTAAFHPLRDVKASVSFPKMDLHYWSSVGEHRGVECSLEGASLTINYLLKLVPLDSGLVQRPRANWTVVSCRGKVRNLVAHVKQRSERKDTIWVHTPNLPFRKGCGRFT